MGISGGNEDEPKMLVKATTISKSKKTGISTGKVEKKKIVTMEYQLRTTAFMKENRIKKTK